MAWPSLKCGWPSPPAFINRSRSTSLPCLTPRWRGALPWAIKDYVSEPVLQLAMDYVDLPTPPAGRPRINVICLPKSRVQQLADAINGIATLQSIISDELALTSLYDADETVRMLLWQPKGQDLQLLVFHQGGALLLPPTARFHQPDWRT